MSIRSALIDFPRLQEQIVSRILASQEIETSSMTTPDAVKQLLEFNLALFFWPESGHGAADRFARIKTAKDKATIPLVVVTTEIGRRNVMATLGPCDYNEIMITPLQPDVVSQQLNTLVGNRRNRTTRLRLDVEWVNPFITATVDTLKQMADLTCERTSLEMRNDARSYGDISGVMVLSGSAQGFVAVTCQNALARSIVCRMIGVELGQETDDDTMDCMGELMNVIAGAAKAELINTKHAFQLTIPNVILGGPHHIGQPRSGAPIVVIGFDVEGERLEVMVCIRSLDRKPSAPAANNGEQSAEKP